MKPKEKLLNYKVIILNYKNLDLINLYMDYIKAKEMKKQAIETHEIIHLVN